MVIKRKVKGITYIYERTTVDGKRHEKVIGKVDKDDKEIYYTDTVNDRDSDGNGREREEKQHYKTKAIAAKDNDISSCPDRLAVPTSPNFEHSISWHQEGKAHLFNLSITTDSLEFKDGKMFFKGALEPISTVELKDMSTNEGIEEIDIPLLTMYYSIILNSFMEKVKQGWDFRVAANMITRIYAPDLMRCLDTLSDEGGASEDKIARIMSKTRDFHTIVGIHHITRNGRPDKSYFPVMNFEGYDSKTNTISFYSPYLMYIVRTIFADAIKLDRKGDPRLKRNGQPMLWPSNSFLIKPSIVSERNKAAVENVFILVQLIEQAGNNTPHIKASTIVERNEALKQRLKRDTHPNRLLSRVFKRTWELLREQTTLLDTYEDIKLPDPDDVANIPTSGNIDKVIFSFPHKGKNKKSKTSSAEINCTHS